MDSDIPGPDKPLTLQQRLAKLTQLKERYRQLGEEAKQAKEEHDWFEYQTIEFLQQQGLPSLHLEGVAKFAVKETDYHKIHDMEAFTAWCQENELVGDFLKEAPQKNRLNELVRERLATGEELPPGVGFYTKSYISITKE